MRRIDCMLFVFCAAVLSTAYAADAQTTSSTLYACFPNEGGRVRVVGSLSQCNPNETGISWNVQGPQGPAGPQGPVGPQGLPGALGLAAQTCPMGQFVAGFDQTGRILCGAPGASTPGAGTPPPPPTPQPSVAQLIVNGLNALVGNEFGGSSPINIRTPVGTVTGVTNFLGFAFCSPPNPSAAPASSSPIYGCTWDVHATAATDGTSLFVTIQMANLFGDGSARVTVPPAGTSSFDGFVLLSDVVISATAPLVDDGAGLKRFGPLSQFSVNYSDSQVQIDGGGLVGDLLQLTRNLFYSFLAASVSELAKRELNDQLAAVPPFTL